MRTLWKRSLMAAAAGAVLVLATACETVPFVGRNQLLLVGDGEMNTLGVQQFQEVKQTEPLCADAGTNQRVTDIGARIARAADQHLAAQGRTSGFQWEFIVIQEDDTVNAWCMPGGKVAVYTGILPVAQDDNGLAVIMAHEIAHAIARHGAERMSQALALEMGGAALSAALASKPAQTRDLFLQSAGLVTNVGVVLPFSRNMEYEADRIGLILMAMAGYDPHAAVPLWERMNASGGERPPEFLSTHPAPANRIAAIQQMIPEAMQYYRQP
ncbi:MAG: M48 family metallopeptidase [Candidatus Hydrogenedentes bacterium]|nr:M48 family metallopeptidase [Candidatus Hydrogenedentota bacterium]